MISENGVYRWHINSAIRDRANAVTTGKSTDNDVRLWAYRFGLIYDRSEFMEPPAPRKKSKHQQQVELFMERAGHTVRSRPEMPDEDERKLRASLILEEAVEFAEAAGLKVIIVPRENAAHDITLLNDGDPDLEEMADACADISVVNTGALSAMGISDCSLFYEVDENNLQKFVETGPCEECQGRGFNYPIDLSTETVKCIVCTGRGTLGGYRRDDGKWIKPLAHPRPDIGGVLEIQALEVEKWEESNSR